MDTLLVVMGLIFAISIVFGPSGGKKRRNNSGGRIDAFRKQVIKMEIEIDGLRKKNGLDKTLKSVHSKRDALERSGSVVTGLVIDEPWISKILSGEKTWEMRTKPTKKRERIALIKKGSGLVIGVASIEDCIGPLSESDLEANFLKHRVPISEIQNWRYAWVLGQSFKLTRPVPYVHRSGAVVFVRLDTAASLAIDEVLAVRQSGV